MDFLQSRKMGTIANRLVLASRLVEIESPLIKKSISELERLKGVKELKYIALECASPKLAEQAVSALKNLKAVDQLLYLGANGSPEVRKQSIAALENIKAVDELKELGRSPSYEADEFKKQAIIALEKMLPEFIKTKAVPELQYLKRYACNKAVARQADLELERLKSEESTKDKLKSAEELLHEINNALSTLN